MAYGTHGKNGKMGVTFATYLLLASFVLVVGRYLDWYQVRRDYSIDVPANSFFNRAFDARVACPEQVGVRVIEIDAPTVDAARKIVERDLPLCVIRSVVRHRS
jgi:hypothetical protein